MKSIILCLVFVLAYAGGQRITTIQLDGVQYFISRMNPYSPELNYFLAYQYCRSLGLQLASFETKEKVESMTEYLQNAGYGKYNFWTSGNRLGTGMFLWMSTGLPFNATFDYFEKSPETVGMDPLDHNSNTSPQRTARDSSGLQKGCVHLKAPSLRWAPEDCSAVKDFICEQTRCYYYNYGSIPVSSAQG
ncbi:C-type lectin 37Da isoform X2 [Anopheles arabiensis]|nr:C-type lectin 37Da isoform X5 [Anopheles stephensi]XP_040153129.1 C-type lectin 37Da isoform X2 [Anopheles arabiensis]XP_041761924.1 C-type lectin 37Da isoform X5 [Anopheles merus]XP_061507659.1 C-type lectin 37Da isoform X5 [Anopheles gambiae]